MQAICRQGCSGYECRAELLLSGQLCTKTRDGKTVSDKAAVPSKESMVPDHFVSVILSLPSSWMYEGYVRSSVFQKTLNSN